MLEAALLTSLALVLYNYVVYPLLVIAAARLRPRPSPPPLPAERSAWPTVSFVIAAYNEERVISQKLCNTLALDYPRERLEILVVADGSTDRTHEIAAAFASEGVVTLHTPQRRGKSAAINRGVEQAGGEIVVFSDANNDFAPWALQALVRRFADPAIGGVGGVKQIKPCEGRQSTQGDGLYWRYESAIKEAEGRIGSITNADGEIFAIRRGLYRPLDERIINDDTQVTFDLVNQGYRVVYEPAAQSYEYASASIRDDFYVKVRMVAGGFQSLVLNWRMFLSSRRGFTVAFLSHKALRWITPLALITIFVCSAMLAARPLCATLLAAQLLLYVTAAYGARAIQRGSLPSLVYLPFYFTAMNLAALFGLWRFLRRTQGIDWRKAAR